MILALLDRQPLYGFEIAKRITEETDGLGCRGLLGLTASALVLGIPWMRR